MWTQREATAVALAILFGGCCVVQAHRHHPWLALAFAVGAAVCIAAAGWWGR